MVDLSGNVDISELTWEQKERVLRFLFAKMNGTKDLNTNKKLPPIQDRPLSITDRERTDDDQTFLTNAAFDDAGQLKRPLLPEESEADSIEQFPAIQSGTQVESIMVL